MSQLWGSSHKSLQKLIYVNIYVNDTIVVFLMTASYHSISHKSNSVLWNISVHIKVDISLYINHEIIEHKSIICIEKRLMLEHKFQMIIIIMGYCYNGVRAEKIIVNARLILIFMNSDIHSFNSIQFIIIILWV